MFVPIRSKRVFKIMLGVRDRPILLGVEVCFISFCFVCAFPAIISRGSNGQVLLSAGDLLFQTSAGLCYYFELFSTEEGLTLLAIDKRR